MSTTSPSTTDVKLTTGVKYDSGKAPVYRGVLAYFPNALKAVAEISAFGARKYDWKNWQGLDDGYNRYSDGLARHIVAENIEGPLDSESGLPHAAHAAWNALARLEFYLKENND